jgi:hypothetical protein
VLFNFVSTSSKAQPGCLFDVVWIVGCSFISIYLLPTSSTRKEKQTTDFGTTFRQCRAISGGCRGCGKAHSGSPSSEGLKNCPFNLNKILLCAPRQKVPFVLACFQSSAAPRPENSNSDEKDALFANFYFFCLKIAGLDLI